MIWCFVNRTNSIRNIVGLVIRKMKPIPVFDQILRPMIGVSLSIMDNETLYLTLKRLYEDES
jgi:hypothetical protein